jgi:glutamate dehydrogenase/leucine dehydrogenase
VFATIRKLLGTALGLTLERSRTGRVTLSEAAVGLAVERVYDAMKRRRMI